MSSPWLQIKVATDSEHAPLVESALAEAGAQAVSLEDAGDEALLEPLPGATPLWQAVRVVGLFDADIARESIQAALARVDGGGRLLETEFEQLPDQDWSRVWLDDWQPLCFGRRLWVVPRTEEVPADGAVVVRLDPGLAFGTGTHVTTALCLEWLDAHGVAGEDVLDYGCGSGVLAIAALCLGARAATATDIDGQALEATRDNAEVNGVAERLTAVTVDAVAAHCYDVILANILARPLVELAPYLAAHQQPGGRLVLAGLLADQADEVCAAYEPAYSVEIGAEREGWVRLEGVRRARE